MQKFEETDEEKQKNGNEKRRSREERWSSLPLSAANPSMEPFVFFFVAIVEREKKAESRRGQSERRWRRKSKHKRRRKETMREKSFIGLTDQINALPAAALVFSFCLIAIAC